MPKFIQLKLAQLILVYLLHWLCFLWLLLLFIGLHYWFGHFFAILKGLCPWILLFLFFSDQDCFGSVLHLVAVDGLDLVGKLLHLFLFFLLFLPFLPTNVGPKSSQLGPLFLWFFGNWLSTAIHRRSVGSFFGIVLLGLFSFLVLQFLQSELLLSLLFFSLSFLFI